MTRLIAAPAIGYLVLHDQHAWAAGLFAYAGITDLLDGWIARRWNRKTVVGTVIDPMADKALMTILTVCLAVKGALPGMFEIIVTDYARKRSSRWEVALLYITNGSCSVAGDHHPGPRRRSRHRSYILSLDLPSAPQDLLPLLGLLPSLRRGPPYHNQQIQHILAGWPHRPHHSSARHCRGHRADSQHYAVSIYTRSRFNRGN